MIYRKRGFSLVELVMVIMVLLLLLSFLQPSISKLVSRGKVTKCANNLSQLASGLIVYVEDNNDNMPTSYNEYAPGQIFHVSGASSQWHMKPSAHTGPSFPLSLGHLYNEYVSNGETFYCPDQINHHNGVTYEIHNNLSGIPINGAATGFANLHKFGGYRFILVAYAAPAVIHPLTSSHWKSMALDKKLTTVVDRGSAIAFDTNYNWYYPSSYRLNHDLDVANVMYGDGSVRQRNDARQIFFDHPTRGFANRDAYELLRLK